MTTSSRSSWIISGTLGSWGPLPLFFEDPFPWLDIRCTSFGRECNAGVPSPLRERVRVRVAQELPLIVPSPQRGEGIQCAEGFLPEQE
jgi:hypothetical protein